MKENQNEIFYAVGKTIDAIDVSPKTEAVRDKGFEILYFTDEVDEFAIRALMEFDGKQFKSVSADDLDIQTEEEKKELEEKSKEYKDLFEEMKKSLGDKVSEVRLSKRLTKQPVCLTSKGIISMEMEQILAQMPEAKANGLNTQAPILEINPTHPIFTKLQSLHTSQSPLLSDYAYILLNQAKLIEGFSIDNPAEFAGKMASLMA
jgi:molecular chaperone HtpG